MFNNTKPVPSPHPGGPGLAAHGLGDQRAARGGPPRGEGGAEGAREHAAGAAGEADGLEGRREHQDRRADLCQRGPAEELRGGDPARLPPHHLPGLSSSR